MAPKDITGQCNAHLYLSDDFSDSHITIRCNLKERHKGKHQNCFGRGTVTWEKDERYVCAKHGRQLDDWCRQCYEEDSADGTQ
jgi:hypothetical protein